jgi:hypothetical protein
MKQRATKIYGGVEVQLLEFSTYELDEGEWSASRSGRFKKYLPVSTGYEAGRVAVAV